MMDAYKKKIIQLTVIVRAHPGHTICFYNSHYLHLKWRWNKLYELFQAAEGMGRIYSGRVGVNTHYYPCRMCPACAGR